ncbi:hypothetical protein COO60DRAFT_1640840 [Scenedesmus sp. NREL 46B-D3]|nr:hypothetical protein COO60DRAFT_1640840 [Scenedesmus sp. NREL 46B-D3]
MLQLLQWTMHNTVKGSQAGVAEWASQGCHFAATKGAPELALQAEKLQLDELYGAGRAPEPVGQVLAVMAARHKHLCSSSSSSSSSGGGTKLADALQEQLWKAAAASSSSSSSGGAPVRGASPTLGSQHRRDQQERSSASCWLPHFVQERQPGSGILQWISSQRAHVDELQLGTPELVSMLLFNGSSSYGSAAQRKQLQQMMRGRRGAAEALLALRGKAAMLARSDLELACDDA